MIAAMMAARANARLPVTQCCTPVHWMQAGEDAVTYECIDEVGVAVRRSPDMDDRCGQDVMRGNAVKTSHPLQTHRGVRWIKIDIPPYDHAWLPYEKLSRPHGPFGPPEMKQLFRKRHAPARLHPANCDVCKDDKRIEGIRFHKLNEDYDLCHCHFLKISVANHNQYAMVKLPGDTETEVASLPHLHMRTVHFFRQLLESTNRHDRASMEQMCAKYKEVDYRFDLGTNPDHARAALKSIDSYIHHVSQQVKGKFCARMTKCALA